MAKKFKTRMETKAVLTPFRADGFKDKLFLAQYAANESPVTRGSRILRIPLLMRYLSRA